MIEDKEYYSKKDKEILDKLSNDIENYQSVVERNRKFGIKLNPDSNILKRRTYSKFAMASKHRDLSKEALEWMADFTKNGPYDDIRLYINNHEWVNQYRKMIENAHE